MRTLTLSSVFPFCAAVLTTTLVGILFLETDVARGQPEKKDAVIEAQRKAIERLKQEINKAKVKDGAKDAEIERLHKENEAVKASVNLAQATAQLAELERKQLTRRVVNLEVQLKAAQARNEQLLQQLRELTRRAIGGIEPIQPANAPNPPPNFVQGVIEKVDAKDRALVMLSIGSDAGLAKGHTLEVFRTKPQPKYLGMIRIVDVTAQKAVARIDRTPGINAPDLQAGDNVAANLRNVKLPSLKR